MEKQWITMEQHQCPACGKMHETGAILLDKHMRNSFPGQYTCTGFGFCPDCQKRIDEGYVILIEATNKPDNGQAHMHACEANRTGRICYLKKHVAKDMFGMEVEMAFIDPEAYALLEKLGQQAESEKEPV